MPFYAIEAGGEKKIFPTWPECENFRDAHPSGARYKKFKTEMEARNFLGLPAMTDNEIETSKTIDDAPPFAMDDGAETINGKKHVVIYTDGACAGNPGPGGWGAIVRYKNFSREISGGEAMTTNNRMEITGVVAALQMLKEPCIVDLYSDSKYVIDALKKGWARAWQSNNWHKADRSPAKNKDLWETLLKLIAQHEMRYHWVKGHANNPYNNRCDEMAVAARMKFE